VWKHLKKLAIGLKFQNNGILNLPTWKKISRGLTIVLKRPKVCCDFFLCFSMFSLNFSFSFGIF